MHIGPVALEEEIAELRTLFHLFFVIIPPFTAHVRLPDKVTCVTMRA